MTQERIVKTKQHRGGNSRESASRNVTRIYWKSVDEESMHCNNLAEQLDAETLHEQILLK